jgi:methionyl-tRNA formyltransferase
MVDVVVFGLNRFGEEVYNWLLERDDTTVQALITHEEQYDSVKKLEPELLVSAGFRSIISEEILQIPDLGAVNLHPSYLPYNKGANPNVWSIIEGKPAGVSVHYMTPEIDAGPIIARREVPIFPEDDGRSLYSRLEQEQVDLFKEVWPDITKGEVDTIPQDESSGTFHYKRELSELFELDLDEQVTVADFIDLLRALTFPPYNNAYFEKDGERYYVELNVTPESEVEEADGIHFNIPEY